MKDARSRRQTPPRERGTLEDALDALRAATGITALKVEWEPRSAGDRGIDATVELEGLGDYVVEITGVVTPERLGPVVTWLRRLPEPRLLVARYITPPMSDRLRAEDIQHVDTAGNVYLRRPPFVHIHIVGRKLPARPPGERPAKAFRPAGLSVIFVLLSAPGAGAATYRSIAEMGKVSLGTVAQTLGDLQRLGFIRDTRKGRVVEQRQHLIKAWVDSYVRELRPRLNPRAYQVADVEWWRDTELGGIDVWLGGEPAAALLTEQLHPQVVTIYDHGAAFLKLASRLRVRKSPPANLDVFDRFWNFEPVQLVPGYRLVPPLLVYADLVATADARNREIAELVMDRYLA